MKSLMIAAMLLTLTPAPVHAAAYGPYDTLPLEELRQIDTSALSKAEKKAYKKALKAAEKAEKKRLKAEKKRLKAAAKAEAKAKKAAQKTARKVLKVRDTTRIIRDEFETDTKIKGPTYSFSNMQTVYQLGNGGEVQYFIRTYLNMEEGRLDTQLYLTIKNKTMVDVDLIAARNLTPVRYANRQGLWTNYSSAKLRGGVERKLIPVDKTGDISYGIGSFYEDVVIKLEHEDLIASLNDFQSFDFKLSGGNKSDLVVSIPPTYITGFILKFARSAGLMTEKIENAEQQFELLAQ